MENLDTATHKVVITIGSEGDSEEVGVQIKLSPEITGEQLQDLGYQPACHKFLEKFVLPMLENIYMHSNFPELFDPEAPDISVN